MRIAGFLWLLPRQFKKWINKDDHLVPTLRVVMHTEVHRKETKLMGRSRYLFTQPNQPHFMTLTVLHWLPVFTRPEAVEIIFNSLRYLQNEGLKVYAYVILENHLHLVCSK